MTPMLRAAFVALALLGNAGPDPARVDRAWANFEALRDGRRVWTQLSQQELADVADLDKAVRRLQGDGRSASQRCIDNELRREGGRPSTLARRVIAMKCREVWEPVR